MTVGFQADGKTLSFSQKNSSKEYASFQLPCGKCIECRLKYAREWAIRCVHESKMHPNNSFVTLTYSNENLRDPKLNYRDWQLFVKKLRKTQNEVISYFVTGEYGEQTKRPHWHAIIFNWYPKDAEYKRSNDRGDKIYRSAILNKIWGLGETEIGEVTIESAGYCARYAAKKLVHGKDDEHEYQPISKKSSKHAIGKKWLEKYYRDVFSHGKLILHDGTSTSIPRYYVKWFKKHHSDAYDHYIRTTHKAIVDSAQAISDAERAEFNLILEERNRYGVLPTPLTATQTRKIISREKFKRLQNFLKLK